MKISTRGEDVDIYATVEEISEMLSSNFNRFQEECGKTVKTVKCQRSEIVSKPR